VLGVRCPVLAEGFPNKKPLNFLPGRDLRGFNVVRAGIEPATHKALHSLSFV